MIHTSSVVLETRGNADIHDITDALSKAVAESGLRAGTMIVFCPSSTSAVTTIEFEAGALRDLRRMLDEIIPAGRKYDHNERWGDGNGHSHVRAALLGPSLSIPFVDARLSLGTWQQVIHIDLDVRPRHRELVLQMMGE
jgi:secondary thiamine-phosphate synthase enzyme